MPITGVQIDYKLKDGCASRFNQKMFGRISSRKFGEKTYAYYINGVLHDIPHARIFEGRIFVGTTGFVDYSTVMPFCTEFKVSSTMKQEGDVFLQTGQQRWMYHAKEKGLKLDRT